MSSNWKNPGNWHWVDKNCLPWAQEFFLKEFAPLIVDKEELTLNIVKVKGDCDVNQRKSQIINIFDLVLDGTWTFKGYKGKFEVPEFMHDTVLGELVINFEIDTVDAKSQDVKNTVRKEVSAEIKKRCSHFVSDLMAVHSKDVYISKDEMVGHPTKSLYQSTSKASVTSHEEPRSSSTSIGSLVTITQTISFQCSASDLYDVLTNPKKIGVWTRAPCEFLLKRDSEYSLFGGNISGKVIDFVIDD